MVSNEITGNRKIVGNTLVIPFYDDFPMSPREEESIPLDLTDTRFYAIFFNINDRKDTITLDIGYFPIGGYDMDILIDSAKQLFREQYPDSFNNYKILEKYLIVIKTIK